MFAYCNNSPTSASDPSGKYTSNTLVADSGGKQAAGGGGVITVVLIYLLEVILGECAKSVSSSGTRISNYIDNYSTPSVTNPSSASDYLVNKEAYKDTLSGIASAYELYQCKEAAEEMAKNNNNRGYLIRLYFQNTVSGYVVAPNSKYGNKTAISSNGYHWGYCDQFHVVRCNVYPLGLPEDEWIHAFTDAWGSEPVILYIPLS